MRIVSLIASATEIVCALGAKDQLVGRSHECDYPPDVLSLPALTAPKFKLDGASYEIDARVKAILQEGTSVYRVDAEALRALEPDVIVTQDQCEVCAVSLADVEAALCGWIGKPAKIVSLKPDKLADIWADIERVGESLGRAREAQNLVAQLRGRMMENAARAASQDARPRVACIEWVQPLMAAGNWVPELIEMANGANLLGEKGKHSPWLEWDAVLEADPDIIIVMPCGYDLPRTLEDAALLASNSGYGSLKAVREGRIYAVDGNAYLNRPGPRIAESFDIICEIIHPELFPIKEPGRWQQISASA